MSEENSADTLLDVLSFYMLSDSILMASGTDDKELVKRWKLDQRELMYEQLKQELSELIRHSGSKTESMFKPVLRLPQRVDAAVFIIEVWAQKLILRAWVSNDSFDVLPVCSIVCSFEQSPLQLFEWLNLIIKEISACILLV